MKEDIIKFETAILAEKRGFTRETMGFKTSSVMKDYYNHLGEFNGDCTLNVKSFLNKDKPNKYKLIPAPTQSLLQKWLRVRHNIIVTIRFYDNGSDNIPEYRVEVNHPDTWYEYTAFQKSDIESWEDALELGLQEALKLIIE